MDTVRFGRTGLEVSVAGLGTGGESRLGLSTGHDAAHAVALVRRALDLGVTYFDCAQSYRTEDLLGEGLEHRRDEVAVSTKASPRPRTELLDAAGLRAALEASLRALRTDRLDVYHLHRVLPEDYAYCVAELLPELARQKEAGKIRFLGISESGRDSAHETLSAALADDHFDVVMAYFSILDQSARGRVLAPAMKNDVAVEVMSTARGPMSNPDQLAELIARLDAEGRLPAEVDRADPLGYLLEAGPASLPEAAYCYARHEPGCHVILTGTGDLTHLEENVRAISGPPLPPDVLARTEQLFGGLSGTARRR